VKFEDYGENYVEKSFIICTLFFSSSTPLPGLGLLSLSLFRFRNLLYTYVRTPWMGDQLIARPLPTQDNTNTEHNYTYT
jgi:hypothetical protein